MSSPPISACDVQDEGKKPKVLRQERERRKEEQLAYDKNIVKHTHTHTHRERERERLRLRLDVAV